MHNNNISYCLWTQKGFIQTISRGDQCPRHCQHARVLCLVFLVSGLSYRQLNESQSELHAVLLLTFLHRFSTSAAVV